jgi:hypothetical protein
MQIIGILGPSVNHSLMAATQNRPKAINPNGIIPPASEFFSTLCLCVLAVDSASSFGHFGEASLCLYFAGRPMSWLNLAAASGFTHFTNEIKFTSAGLSGFTLNMFRRECTTLLYVSAYFSCISRET